ncbi:efflux RND transporter periplasmic adaptor subunit [Flindersiella endophytica]
MSDTDLNSEVKQSRPAERRRRRGVRKTAVTVVVLGALGAGGWYAYSQGYVDQLVEQLRDGGQAAAAPTPTLPPETTTVTSQTLQRTEEVEGTLGYGDEYELKSSKQGVVTKLPAEGATVSRGQALYWIDNQPVVLMYGALPLYRTLADGVDDGPDVQQLEENLAELGYDGFTVDEEFTENTADAVEEWQEDLGLEETGRVDPGQIVFLTKAVRVADQLANVGDRVGGPVLKYTGTQRVVSIDLDVDNRGLVEKGDKVTATLPDDTELKGTIATIGTVAHTSGGGQSGEEETSTIDVTVTLDDPKSTAGFDQAPVDIELVSDRRENVLTVPISALLALREGGYGLEVVEGGKSRVVSIEVGMFADGRVEVSGPGIKEGVKVGVAKS